MMDRIRRWLREIYAYARQHPIKVFLLVIVPLLIGGVLQKLLATIGIRLPQGLMGGMSGLSGNQGGLQGLGNAGSGGLGGSVQSLMNIAKMFL
jgi:hypothetical protein